MSLLEVNNIIPLNCHGSLTDPMSFDISLLALAPLPHPISLSAIYVGSAFSEQYDQILE